MKQFQLTIKINSHNVKTYDITCKTPSEAFNSAMVLLSNLINKNFIYSIYEDFGDELESSIKSLKNSAMCLGNNIMLKMVK